ncbi:hypothetical protein LXL04_027039 [Taraxacum kok-saghyz]
MADTTTSRNYRNINADLYKALLEGDDTKVCDICQDLPDGPLHKLTIHNDTVVHVASYYKRNNLVLQLLGLLPEDQFNKLTSKNDAGNTILHATAANNKTVEVAGEMLRREPSLLTMTDMHGETPFFRAARYGKSKSFRFFREEVSRRFARDEDVRGFLVRDDKATILHVAIHSENFDLAHDIAKIYPMLMGEQDGDGMTSFQLLACKPSAFNQGYDDHFFKRFICKFIHLNPREQMSRVPLLKQLHKQRIKSESAKKLATLFIENDASWESTSPLSNEKGIKLQEIEKSHIVINTTSHYSPFFLATKSGSTEIVKEILRVYPQAIEHIDKDGRNILHVAIEYRRTEIYKLVINMKGPLMRLRGEIDKQGNSILHMVGKKVIDQKAKGDIGSPAFVLRDDLLLFEHVKHICTPIATSHVNNDGMTAEQLFIKNNEQLHIDAKEWMKSMAGNCSVVAVLFATVAFTSSSTPPGGFDAVTGNPILESRTFFTVFSLANGLSLTFSLTSIIIFLSILTSSFQLKDFHNPLHDKLLLGLTLLILSWSTMMISVAATIILGGSSQGKDWTSIILYPITFFPVVVFVVSYVRLYKLLIKVFEERLKKVIDLIFPQPSLGPTTIFIKEPTRSFV